MSNQEVGKHPHIPGAVIAVIRGDGKTTIMRGTAGVLGLATKPKPTTTPTPEGQAK